MRPNLTLNYGLRWAVQLPFYALNNVYSIASDRPTSGAYRASGNLFRPGTLTGAARLRADSAKARAPTTSTGTTLRRASASPGRPRPKGGFLGRLIGAERRHCSARGFRHALQPAGMNRISPACSATTPALTITANRNETLGNLGPAPLLFSDRSRLGAPAFPSTPVYPLTRASSPIR